MNLGQTTKRPPRVITRLMKANGSLAAGSLGDIAEGGKATFARTKPCRFGHSFLAGTENLVCSACGLTTPRFVRDLLSRQKIDLALNPEFLTRSVSHHK